MADPAKLSGRMPSLLNFELDLSTIRFPREVRQFRCPGEDCDHVQFLYYGIRMQARWDDRNSYTPCSHEEEITSHRMMMPLTWVPTYLLPCRPWMDQ